MHTNLIVHYIISHPLFDVLSLSVILINTILLAIEDPKADETPSLLKNFDMFFLVFYTVEMCLKIIGLGFFLDKGSYLRDPWNILDFVIVCTGLLSEISSGGSINLSGMRTFRVLRPLKTISGIEGLRIIVSALLKSAKLLLNAFIVLFFFYFLFSIAGL